ncbi:unnamed protein product [Rotaria sp. Silwood1]|nr:unnamed protein product [Rotaria sp. Silwood1]
MARAISHSTKFNRTYMIFISKDAPIGHKQIIDTYDLSFCFIFSMNTTYSHHHNLPFEILLIPNQNCTLYLHVIHLLNHKHTSMYTVKQVLIYENISNIIHLSINIIDVNDRILQFENKHYHFIVQENILPGTFIGRVQVYNAQIVFNDNIFYILFGNDLIQSNNQIMFRIDKDTGDIFLFDYELDYEIKQEYKIMVEAKGYYEDFETGIWTSISSFADIIITVEDINDEKPQIIFYMPDENKNENNEKIMSITKPMLNEEQNHFINSFRSTINLIENDAEVICLTKEESLPINTLLALFHLYDNDQISNGSLSLNLQTYVQCSQEEILLNNKTFCHLSNIFHLTIVRLNVYGLYNSQILDREEYEDYIIHLIANDNDNQSLEMNTLSNSFQSELFIYLILLDINDNVPIFDRTYFYIKIDENLSRKTIITRLQAYDIDKDRNGTVHYELIVKNQKYFSIDNYSGVLRTKRKLDREQCEWYRVGIRAYDLGYPIRKYSSIVIVDIEINNIDDHVPHFTHNIYRFNIEENASIGKIVGRVTIEDKDEQEPMEQMINLSTINDGDIVKFKSSKSNKISRTNKSMIDFLFIDSYRNESLSGLFSIDSQGYIHTLVIFDREIQSNYTFYIFMYDRILKSYTFPTYIIIQILDENDHIPYEPFLSNSSILSIEQTNNDEIILYKFQPIDLDDGLNGFVSIECLNCLSIFYFNIINSSILITRRNIKIPDGLYTLNLMLRDHGLIISYKRFYTLKINLTHSFNSKAEEKLFSMKFIYKYFLLKFSWQYFIIFLFIWFILVLMALWKCYYYDRILINKEINQHKIISKRNKIFIPFYQIVSKNRNFSNDDVSSNLKSTPIRNHSTQVTLRSTSFSRFYRINSDCQLLSSMMNSRETTLTNAATNASYHEDNNDIWQPMNSNKRILNENTSTILHNKNYYFEPIDRDFSTNLTTSQTNHSHSIQRPVPISNYQLNTVMERSQQYQQSYSLQTKTNSTMNINPSNIDLTIRSYGLPRSITTDQFSNNKNPKNRSYYYPSVQDVLDALNQDSNFKESFV